jgi:adenosyl cobinamide kinase/adenosyl cobinamide phosphate guanylyltransferase
VAREFRDLQGQGNQILARAASRVVMVVAGIPMILKKTNAKAPGKD